MHRLVPYLLSKEEPLNTTETDFPAGILFHVHTWSLSMFDDPGTTKSDDTITQNKIVSAAARYGKSDWVWREESASEQNFLVCNSVSFKLYEHEVSRVR